MICNTRYITNDEIVYLRKIGENVELYKRMYPQQKLVHKIKMLRGYLRGAAKRVNWAELDKDKIINFAQAELERYARGSYEGIL
jgi:hypothetical protein